MSSLTSILSDSAGILGLLAAGVALMLRSSYVTRKEFNEFLDKFRSLEKDHLVKITEIVSSLNNIKEQLENLNNSLPKLSASRTRRSKKYDK